MNGKLFSGDQGLIGSAAQCLCVPRFSDSRQGDEFPLHSSKEHRLIVGWRRFCAGLRYLELRRQRIVIQGVGWQAATKLSHSRFIERFLTQPGQRIGIVEHDRHAIVKLAHKLVGLSSHHGEGVIFPQSREPAPIAGMATPRVIEGEGLVFDNIRWNDEGRANREHDKNLSPAIKLSDDGEVIFVLSGALARNGAVAGLHLCSALPPDLATGL